MKTLEARIDGRKTEVHFHSSISDFTLLELLVVISIMAVIAAMLLPALQKARASSYAISCTNNLKNLSIGFSHYQADYNDYIAKPQAVGSANPGDIWESDMFNGKQHDNWSNGLALLLLNSTGSYVADDQAARRFGIFHCPADPRPPRISGTGRPKLSYLEPLGIVVGGVRTNNSLIRSPTKTVLLLDNDEQSENFVNSMIGRSGGLCLAIGWQHVSGIGYNRHLGKANSLYLDGHAGSLSFQVLKSAPTLFYGTPFYMSSLLGIQFE